MVVATTYVEPVEAEHRVTAGGWALRGVAVLLLWAAWTFTLGAVLLTTGNGANAAGPAVAIASTADGRITARAPVSPACSPS